jgi:hypothetical protein
MPLLNAAVSMMIYVLFAAALLSHDVGLSCPQLEPCEQLSWFAIKLFFFGFVVVVVI